MAQQHYIKYLRDVKDQSILRLQGKRVLIGEQRRNMQTVQIGTKQSVLFEEHSPSWKLTVSKYLALQDQTVPYGTMLPNGS